MGPSCEVVLPSEITPEVLSAVDAYLRRNAETVHDTRKGRSWELWVDGRPISVSAQMGNEIALSAGCKSSDDYSALRQLSEGLAAELGGTATEPIG
jgi:hypothetical protein